MGRLQHCFLREPFNVCVLYLSMLQTGAKIPGGVGEWDTSQQIKLDHLQGNGLLSQGMNCRELLRIQHIDVVMEHVKNQVKFQKFNFGKQKSTTSVVPFLSGGLCELLSHIRHFSQGSFQFRRAKVSDTPQSKYAIYAPGCKSTNTFQIILLKW